MDEFEIEGMSSIGGKTVARASILKKTRIGNIEFPQRLISGTDLYHAKQVINEDNTLTIPFNSQVYGINRFHDKQTLTAITRSPKEFEHEADAIVSNAKRKKDVVKTLLVSMNKDVSVSEANDATLVQLQKPLDVINIFDSVDIGSQELESRIRGDLKVIRQFEGSKIVVVRTTLRQRKAILDAKLKVIFGMEEVDGAFIQYANPEYAYSKLAMLRRYFNTPKWIHMYGVPKASSGDERASMMHILYLYAIDSFSLMHYPPFQPTTIPDTNRMDWGLSGYLDFPNEHRQRYEDKLVCSTVCPPDRNRTVQAILDRYTPAKLPSYARVHEAYESQFAFAIARSKVLGKKTDLFDLYKTKDSAMQFIQRAERMSFNVTKAAI